MKLRSLVGGTALLTVMTAGLAAEQAPPGTAPARVIEQPAPPADQPNVQFEITISDEGGGIKPVKKSVVLMVQAGGAGSLRSNGVGQLAPESTGGRGDRVTVDLNADIKMPRWDARDPNKLRARIALDYQPFSPEWKSAPGRVRAQVDVALESGKRTVLWQTTDPVIGLRTMIEVMATVLK